MPTLGWKDVAYVETDGPVRFRNFLVSIGAEHIARWKEDPDGRYKLRVHATEPDRAELDKFFPSL